MFVRLLKKHRQPVLALSGIVLLDFELDSIQCDDVHGASAPPARGGGEEGAASDCQEHLQEAVRGGRRWRGVRAKSPVPERCPRGLRKAESWPVELRLQDGDTSTGAVPVGASPHLRGTTQRLCRERSAPSLRSAAKQFLPQANE